MIRIDGSRGEGGGQILRSALTLAMCTGQSFELVNIRAKRQKPGLLRQHLTAVKAAAQISSAYVEGAALGSDRLLFEPNQVSGGKYEFAIGSAGSTSLVLQTLIMPLALADKPSEIIIHGGTHTQWAPTTDYLLDVFLPNLRNMGIDINLELVKSGFYPAGGGEIRAYIKPLITSFPLYIGRKNADMVLKARITLASLDLDIAKRQERLLQIAFPDLKYIEIRQNRAISAGNVVEMMVQKGSSSDVVTSIGRRGLPSNKLIKQLVKEVNELIDAPVAIGKYLADQLLVPMALLDGGCVFSLAPSEHFLTNIEVIKMFMEPNMDIKIMDNNTMEFSLHTHDFSNGSYQPKTFIG